MSKRYYTYILSNKNDTTLYVGVTNDLERRVAEHRSGMIPACQGTGPWHERAKRLGED